MVNMSDRFDYEEAERDIFDNGGDPDYLSHYDPERRDRFLRDMGLNPDNYKPYRDRSSRSSGASRSSGSSDIFSDLDGSDDSCYITTACIRAKHLPDDCEELTLLRRFRDSYMRSQPGGEEDIRAYYRSAPSLVERINARKDAAQIWSVIYEEMILPCVELIKKRDYAEVYRLYKTYTLQLGEQYGE